VFCSSCGIDVLQNINTTDTQNNKICEQMKQGCDQIASFASNTALDRPFNKHAHAYTQFHSQFMNVEGGHGGPKSSATDPKSHQSLAKILLVLAV